MTFSFRDVWVSRYTRQRKHEGPSCFCSHSSTLGLTVMTTPTQVYEAVTSMALSIKARSDGEIGWSVLLVLASLGSTYGQWSIDNPVIIKNLIFTVFLPLSYAMLRHVIILRYYQHLARWVALNVAIIIVIVITWWWHSYSSASHEDHAALLTLAFAGYDIGSLVLDKKLSPWVEVELPLRTLGPEQVCGRAMILLRGSYPVMAVYGVTCLALNVWRLMSVTVTVSLICIVTHCRLAEWNTCTNRVAVQLGERPPHDDKNLLRKRQIAVYFVVLTIAKIAYDLMMGNDHVLMQSAATLTLLRLVYDAIVAARLDVLKRVLIASCATTITTTATTDSAATVTAVTTAATNTIGASQS